MTGHATGGRQIVAGIDGSAVAEAAARWAAAVAAHGNLPLRLVHVLPPAPVCYGAPAPVPDIEAVRAVGDAALSHAAEIIRGEQPAVAIECTTRTGPTPADVLLDVAPSASMVVIGSACAGPVEGFLNATALRLAHHAACPVTVWRLASGPVLPDRRPVIVGVDGSEISIAAVRWACSFAASFEAPVVAVHIWTGTAPQRGTHCHEYPVDATEKVLLAESVAGCRTEYPDLTIEQVTERGTPADVLLARCRQAQLLVVGSHGRGALGRALLGSTSQDMLHRAPCPVTICHPDATPAPPHAETSSVPTESRRAP